MKPLPLPADFQALIAFCKANVIGATIPLADVNSMGQVIMPGATPQLPPYPKRPVDVRLAALYDTKIMPLYNSAAAMVQAIANATAPPVAAPPPDQSYYSAPSAP